MVGLTCPQCGAPIENGMTECKYCGERLTGVHNDPAQVLSDKSKVAAGLLAIFLGALGIHKFYLGYKKEGIIMLVICLLGFLLLFGPMVMSVIGLIEGIIYLTKSDAEFYEVYVQGRKGWF